MNDPLENLLIHDHSGLDELLEQVFAALLQGDQQKAFESLDYFWARVAMHIRAEHLHLFPTLLNASKERAGTMEGKVVPTTTDLESAIAQLRDDHNFFMRELAEVVGIMRESIRKNDVEASLRGSGISDRLNSVKLRLMTHNSSEESHIYPLVNLLLTMDRELETRRRMKEELDNLPRRFVSTSPTMEMINSNDQDIFPE